MAHDVTLLRDIALSIIFAALLGHGARLLRQPLRARRCSATSRAASC